MSIVGRQRKSPWPAIPMDQALQIVEDLSFQFPRETKIYPVNQLSVGRVIAEKCFSRENVPLYRISIKDGYAVISSDGIGDRKVVGISTAGSSYTNTVNPGECVRISTGSVVPNGADAVVQVEDTSLSEFHDDVELIVNIQKSPRPGQDIREPGSELREGELIFDAGCELGSAEIGLLNSFGYQNVVIFRKPRVCVMSTGNELVEPSAINVPPGHIRDSNRPQLLALFNGQGFKAIDGGIVPDQIDTIEAAIRNAAKLSSVIVTSGGVSMGEKDYLKQVLQDHLGLKIVFGRVWMKPGLPCTVAFGNISGNRVVVFALPGNPVSSWVCAHLFVTPLLRTMAGHQKAKPTIMKVKVSHEIKLGPRPEYCRAWVESHDNEDMPIATVTGNQISSRLMSLVGAHALLILPSNELKERIEKNETVDAMIISKF